jgi:hypothetical protein
VELALKIALVTLLLCLSACGSPETTRTRGGGPGADVGNRTLTVRMHEGARPFDKTPKVIVSRPPSLEPARHAERLSRP